MRRQSEKKNVIIMILLVCTLIISLGESVQASQKTDTDVGVGFVQGDTVQSSVVDNHKASKQPDEVRLPSTKNKGLPQLGVFIEPLVLVLLGLVIWLVVLSIVVLKKYLNKEIEA